MVILLVGLDKAHSKQGFSQEMQRQSKQQRQSFLSPFGGRGISINLVGEPLILVLQVRLKSLSTVIRGGVKINLHILSDMPGYFVKD
jgi:hypothetical protein